MWSPNETGRPGNEARVLSSDLETHPDAFFRSSLIFSLRMRTLVDRCWSILSPEMSMPLCMGKRGGRPSSRSPWSARRTSRGATWFQPLPVKWWGGTESRVFRIKLAERRGMEGRGDVCVPLQSLHTAFTWQGIEHRHKALV